MIISVPVQTARMTLSRLEGALVVLVAVQLSVARIVSAASVQAERSRPSSPNDHFPAGPNGPVQRIEHQAHWSCS